MHLHQEGQGPRLVPPAAAATAALAEAQQRARPRLPAAAPQALADIQFGASERAVRINSVQSGLAEEDLRALLAGPALPDALVVPKARVGPRCRVHTGNQGWLARGTGCRRRDCAAVAPGSASWATPTTRPGRARGTPTCRLTSRAGTLLLYACRWTRWNM